MNLATNARAYRAGTHPGWEKTALDGLLQTLPIVVEKRIKIVINGGALNPAGLAARVASIAAKQQLGLKVAYVEGDNFMDRIDKYIDPKHGLQHIDSESDSFVPAKNGNYFLQDRQQHEVICANAYLGARGIIKALNNEADIVITGRVSDASPVIGIAAWWHGWSDTDFDLLAAALVAGHFVECSGYITGANFCDFERYPMDKLIDVGLGIAEISNDGTVVLTKHETLNGIVNVDTATSQLLYELQGLLYLNSDVVADLRDIEITQEGPNRVCVRGVKGLPPPPTTKLAVFYVGGYQIEMTINATGRNTAAKYNLMKAQLDHGIKQRGLDKLLDVFEMQIFASAEENADTQAAGTTYARIFVQSESPEALRGFLDVFLWFAMQHFHGMHCTNDMRNLAPPPKEFLAYFPAMVPQAEINEKAVFMNAYGKKELELIVEPVRHCQHIGQRASYDTANPADLDTFGDTAHVALDTVVLGRSGDKGGNVNMGLFVHEADEYEWLRTFMTRNRLQQLIGKDWRPEFWIERVEMPKIRAVHFVVYGILGRGVSSTPRLDCLGKGFVDWIRSRHVDVPRKFIDRYDGRKYEG